MKVASFLVGCALMSRVAVEGFASRNGPSSSTFRRHASSTKKFLKSAVTTSESSTTAKSGTLTLFSPCKINLFLRILRKREDGYHDLASLFQAVGFGDTLELTPIEGTDHDEFSCNMEGVPVDSTNLVLRALELMRKNTGRNQFFKANLIKQVPAQAGLVGGSANAATAMWGANELMGKPASLEEVRPTIPFDLFRLRCSSKTFACLRKRLDGEMVWRPG